MIWFHGVSVLTNTPESLGNENLKNSNFTEVPEFVIEKVNTQMKQTSNKLMNSFLLSFKCFTVVVFPLHPAVMWHSYDPLDRMSTCLKDI